MMTSAPAPVREIRSTGIVAVPKKTGLLGMRPGSDHRVTIGRGTPAETFVYVRARPSEDAALCDSRYVCLHAACAGKTWGNLRELHEGHPAPSQMAAKEEIHVYGLWSDQPVDASKIAPLKAEAAKAEKRRIAAEEAAEKDGGLNDVAEARAKVAKTRAEEAAKALADATAPIGLIAPPELTAAEQ